jgi:hypothetical protein
VRRAAALGGVARPIRVRAALLPADVLIPLDDAGAAQRASEDVRRLLSRRILRPSSRGKTRSEGDASSAVFRNGTSSEAFEALLGRRVDLATPGMIRQEYRERVYAEAVRAAY